MAVSADDVKKLAELSRIELSDSEVAALQGEIDSILSYIDTIRQVKLPDTPTGSKHLDIENVMRADENPHGSGAYTDDIVSQMPRTDGNYLKVKKILG